MSLEMVQAFTKWKIITYICVVFLPPYALYRVWCEKSEFRRSEKYVWTMILMIYVAYFFKLLAAG